MRSKLSLIVTLFAWLLATGSHWDLVQTFAWGNMIAGYTQEMSFSAAVQKTFSPETMCNLCHAVADAKQQESQNAPAPGSKAPGKILLVCASTSAIGIFRLPTLAARLHPSSALLSADRAAPPVPPPRVLV